MTQLKKVFPPLTAEQIQLCPYGSQRCKLCRLPIEIGNDIMNKKFNENVGYKQIRVYLKEMYDVPADYTELCDHFNKHIKGIDKTQGTLSLDDKNISVSRALAHISGDVKVTTSEDIEKAYSKLVKMAKVFVNNVSKLQDQVAIEFDTRTKEELRDELKNISMIDLFDKFTKLQKESREFVKEISALRAPKVLVANFLESFMNSLIKDLSILVGNMAGELKNAINEELADAGHPNLLGDKTFSDVFQNFAMDYRDRLLNLRREHLSEAMSTLQDLEKII